MADKVVSLEFNVNTDKAVTEINQVTKATEGAEKATVNYNEELTKIKKSTDGAGIKDLNKALKEYQNIAIQAGESSPIGRQALAEAGELKDRLLDLKAAVKTTGQDGLQLQASLQLGGGIVAGFGAVQGVMALVGSESEDLQKTLVKLQAVQATLASVEEIRSVLEKESALRIVAVTVAEKARAAATAVSTFVTNASTVSLKLFRTALIATGIGAIVVVLIAAAEAMGVFGNSTDEASEKLEKQKKIREELDAQIEESLKKDLDVRKSRQGGIQDIKSEIEILKAKGATNTELFLAEKKLIQEQLNNLAFTKGVRGKLNADELEEQKKLQLDKHLLNLKYIKDSQDANKKSFEDNKIKKGLEAQKEYETRAEALYLLQQLDEQEKLLRDQKIADEAEALIIAMDNEAILAEQKKKQREKDLEEEIRIRDAKVQIANDLQSTLTDLGNLIINDSAKAVKFNKAMALIQIGIDTATALSKALSVTQSPSPDNVATGGLAGVAKYAGIAAMIFANAAKAKQILASGNGSATPPTLGGGGMRANLPTQLNAPQTPGQQSTILRNQTPTVKAIVVESDITITQKRVNSIKQNATI
jgi:hypothetical protein